MVRFEFSNCTLLLAMHGYALHVARLGNLL